jgi:uncharacterized protein (TIGR03067 family)
MQKRVLFAVAVFIALGVFASAGAADKAADEAVKKEMTALKGEWKLVSRVQNGTETAAETIKNRAITFEDGKYTLRDGKDIVVEATFTIDPSKDPKVFDLTITTSGNMQLGIYKIDGDTLTFCIGGIGDERPTDFTCKEASNRTLTKYKREKK